MANFTINEKSKKDISKAYWIKFMGYSLIVGFKGNLTKTRKLVIARELIDFCREQKIALADVSEEALLEQALKSVEYSGSVYKDLTIEHGSTTEIATGVVRPYVDISAHYSASNGNSPAKIKHITIG